jgi:3-isopropylmalate/(R)-2-methylmalate dehydratase large subunit
MIEKILLDHSGREAVRPGDILDVSIDTRVARDFGGANVVRNMEDYCLTLNDPSSTFFTFDCNPTGSDQKYAENQHRCRLFARQHGIKVYDINRGVGTHILIEEGLAWPGSTAVSTDSHANILGAIGAFGQGMGDRDIAAAWSKGRVWFRVPETVSVVVRDRFPEGLSAKDIMLNLLSRFGASRLLGMSVELSGEAIDELGVDERITIASMATEMGAVTILIPPNTDVIRYCESRVCRKVEPLASQAGANFAEVYKLDAREFEAMVSLPGKPHNAVPVDRVRGTKIDSAILGSCTNGRLQDMRAAAGILRGRKVAPGVVLKIVPSTDRIWNMCLEEGLMEVFKEARALVSNPGCAGCASGQVGQNGPGEVTVSTGNRNFPGKQGKGEVYLASPEIVAASAVAGYITTPDQIPDTPHTFNSARIYYQAEAEAKAKAKAEAKVLEELGAGEREAPGKPVVFTGKAWYIPVDNIDTDMIFHNRHLTVTDPLEMRRHAFGNLPGYENFPEKAGEGDILVTGQNFGSGSSRQQAVDCFLSLGIRCIIARSFGAIYERNAINAALAILVADGIEQLQLDSGDELQVNLETGKITNLSNKVTIQARPFSGIQMEIYQNGGLL